MSRVQPRMTDTIPRLDKVEYLFETLAEIGEGGSLDELRLSLIDLRRSMDRQTRRDLRPEQGLRRKMMDNPTPEMFWANAREAVRELIRLGMVSRARVPNTFQEFEGLKGSKFELTPEGKEFVELGRHSVWKFRDAFFCAMDSSHPYLRMLRRVLADHELFIPRVSRADIPGDVEDWRWGSPQPLEGLAEKLANEINAATQRSASADELLDVLKPGLTKTWSLHPPKGDNKSVTRWAIKIINEQIMHAVAVVNQIRMDSIAFRHAVSLLSDFHVGWETRSLSDRDGWTIWLTAEGESPDVADLFLRGDDSPARLALRGEPWISRRSASDETILHTTVKTILSNPKRSAGFSLIHEIRALVCHQLRIHGWSFNSSLRNALDSQLTIDGYELHVDAAGGDKLPSSEEPLIYNERPYYLITLIKGA